MPGYLTDTVARLETNLDDCTAEIIGEVMTRLFAAGALDVWHTAIHMKKNRPGTMLSVLCDEKDTERLADIIFAETTAFGLRVDTVRRLKLDREFRTVSTAYGEITIKLGLRGGKIIQCAPEFESCRAAAERVGVAVRTVFGAAMEAGRSLL